MWIVILNSAVNSTAMQTVSGQRKEEEKKKDEKERRKEP